MADARKSNAWHKALNGVAIGLALVFVLYVALIWAAHTYSMPWLGGGKGFSITKLGPLGDSFGPLTALFAAVAAVGAWKSYEAQRQQLSDEQNRHRVTRFDETFFRLLDHYDRELRSVIVNLPGGALGNEAGRYTGVGALDVFERSVAVFNTEHGMKGELDSFNGNLEREHFGSLLRLKEQEIAITRWLMHYRRSVAVRYRGALLVAKLSDVELWFWDASIRATGDDKLIRFAAALGIDRVRGRR